MIRNNLRNWVRNRLSRSGRIEVVRRSMRRRWRRRGARGQDACVLEVRDDLGVDHSAEVFEEGVRDFFVERFKGDLEEGFGFQREKLGLEGVDQLERVCE